LDPYFDSGRHFIGVHHSCQATVVEIQGLAGRVHHILGLLELNIVDDGAFHGPVLQKVAG